MKKAALYVRVSTEEQKKHGLSVDNQLDALKKYCDDNFIKDYKVYNDAGLSGHAAYTKRPALMQLISDCRAGEISVILFTRLDRWFRSVKDYYLVQDQIGSVPWKAIWEDYETETSSGQLKVNIMLSIAEAEAARTSEKVKSVLQYKREHGEYLGTPPIGFKVENKYLVIDKDDYDFVKGLFETYTRTLSLTEVSRASNGRISVSQACRMMHNPKYVGTYITEAEHDLIEEHLAQHIHGTNQYHYSFSGLLVCPSCGSTLVGGQANHHRRYRCVNCWKFGISELKAEKLITQQIEPQLNEYRIKAKNKPNKNNEKKIAELQRKADRLKDLYIDGEIERAEYDKRKAAYEEQIAALKPIKHGTAPTLPQNWQTAYNGLNEQNKQIFWRSILHQVIVSEDKKSCALFFNTL